LALISYLEGPNSENDRGNDLKAQKYAIANANEHVHLRLAFKVLE
jgi:hypothetical protein